MATDCLNALTGGNYGISDDSSLPALAPPLVGNGNCSRAKSAPPTPGGVPGGGAAWGSRAPTRPITLFLSVSFAPAVCLRCFLRFPPRSLSSWRQSCPVELEYPRGRSLEGRPLSLCSRGRCPARDQRGVRRLAAPEFAFGAAQLDSTLNSHLLAVWLRASH